MVLTKLGIENIGIIGAGAFANEVSVYAHTNKFNVVCYIINYEYINSESKTLNIDISNHEELYNDLPVVVAVGTPGLKRQLVELWPGNSYININESTVKIIGTSTIGKGGVIAPGVIVSNNTEIGDFVTINMNSSVGHDVIIKDYVTISPGVNIGGKTTLEKGVFIGIGASVKDGVHIGEGAVIGAGAVILNDVPKLAVCVGVPGKVIKYNEDWFDEF